MAEIDNRILIVLSGLIAGVGAGGYLVLSSRAAASRLLAALAGEKGGKSAKLKVES